MATATFVESGSERSSKGLLYFFKYSRELFRTGSQLDQARVALGKTRDYLSECDQDRILKALEAEDSVNGTIHIHVFHRLKRERASLRGDIDVLEEKPGLKTVFKARKLRHESERLQRRTYAFSESARDIVNVQFQTFSFEKRQHSALGPSSLPDNTPPREGLEHPQSCLTAEKNAVEVETISKMIREVALTASQSPTGNIIFIQNSCIHQNSSISHSSLRQNADDKSTPFYTCPYCSPTLSFDSPTNLIVHLDEVHKLRE